MYHALGYLFRYLAWLAAWAQSRGIAVVDVLLCAAPVVLVFAFIRARFIEWIRQDNPQTIGQYPVRGMAFTPTKSEGLQVALGVIVITIVILIVLVLPTMS